MFDSHLANTASYVCVYMLEHIIDNYVVSLSKVAVKNESVHVFFFQSCDLELHK